MNSGPGGSWKVGQWGPALPYGWRIWYADGHTAENIWEERPAGVLGVVVYDHLGRPTRMRCCDEYPPPPGVTGPALLGEQLGPLNSPEWFAAKARMDAEALVPPPRIR